MEADAETLFNYLGKRYEDAYANSPILKGVVEDILTKVAPHSRILDVGCGTGRPVAERLAIAGHDVYGIDVAENMVNIAQSQVRGTFQKADMRTYNPLHRFDAVLASLSLFQISPSETSSLVYRFAEWVREGGIVVIGVTPTSGLSEGQGCYDSTWDCVRWLKKPWMTQYTNETFFSEQAWQQMLQHAGFIIEAEKTSKYCPNDDEHKVSEVHYFITGRKTSMHPLLGPHLVPRTYSASLTRNESAWRSLQDRLIIEDQNAIQNILNENERILSVADGYRHFTDASSKYIEAIQPLSDDLPFSDKAFDASLAWFALESVSNLEKPLQEVARVTDLAIPTARIVLVQGAPDNEVSKLVNTICAPLSESKTGIAHQSSVLQSAMSILSMLGFGDLSLHRLSTSYRYNQSGKPDCGQAAEDVAGLWHSEDKNYPQMKEALIPELELLFDEHSGRLRNELVLLVARPLKN